MLGEHSPVRASSVRALERGSGTPMSRVWVPCGKHATLVCWDLVAGKNEVRVQRLPDGLDTFTCRREAVGRPPEERGRRRAFWILELGGLCPNVAPADGEITHGRHLQQEKGCKSVKFAGKEPSNAKIHTWLQLAKW